MFMNSQESTWENWAYFHKLVFIAFLVLAPLPSKAGESCNELLRLGIYNVNQSTNASDAQAIQLSSFCSADYSNSSTSSSQAATIEASYGLFSGGAGGSANRQDILTKQSQLCKSGFDSSKYSASVSDYSKTVFQGSLAAWNRCQELANQGLVFSVEPSSTLQGIAISIAAPTGLQATYYGVEQFGSGTSVCSTMANGKILDPSHAKPFRFSASSTVTVTCKRNMVKTGSDLSADAQDLIFVTSAKNLRIPLAATGNFSRVTASNIINSINSSLSGTIAAFNKSVCPSGWKIADGTNNTPDLRGVFIRGLDSGRGIDNGRTLGSLQDHQLQTHVHRVMPGVVQNYSIGPVPSNIYAVTSGPGATVDNTSATTPPLNANSGAETRPQNVALMYCVKD